MPKTLDPKQLLSRALALWRAFVLGAEPRRRLEQAKGLLLRGARRIPYAGVREPLLKWLAPRELPADALGGLEGSLRASGEYSSPGIVPRPSAPPLPSLDGEPSGPHLSVRRRKDGTFSAAPPRAQVKRSLTGGVKALDGDELRAVQHEAQRRKEQARAVALINKHRAKLGSVKVQKLAALPRTFAPRAMKAYREQFPELSAQTLQLLVPLVAPLSRELCDKAALRPEWHPHERDALLGALSAAVREVLKPSIEALLAMPGPARRCSACRARRWPRRSRRWSRGGGRWRRRRSAPWPWRSRSSPASSSSARSARRRRR